MIDFMRYRLVYFLISGVVLLAGIISLLTQGLQPAIDFTGGTILEFRIQNSEFITNENQATQSAELTTDIESTASATASAESVSFTTDQLRQITADLGLELGSIQTSDQDAYLLKLKPIDRNQKDVLEASVSAQIGPVDELRFETVGPVLGSELLRKTFIAAAIAVLGILLYIAWAFKNLRYGVSAILALIHDTLVVVGIFSLLGYFFGVEVDVLFVTALLTTMSFSVHDTIVVFDQIRVLRKKETKLDFKDVVNKSLTDTMARSLNNSLTIIFMLLALFLLGGETVRWFVFALLVGTVAGTYSSPFVATPILYTWYQIRDRKR